MARPGAGVVELFAPHQVELAPAFAWDRAADFISSPADWATPMAEVVNLATSSRIVRLACLSDLNHARTLGTGNIGPGSATEGTLGPPRRARALLEILRLGGQGSRPCRFPLSIRDLHLGPFALRWYALAYLAGILLSGATRWA